MTDFSHQISETTRARYLNDPVFHALVDSMVSAALEHDLSVEDFIEAFRVVDVKVREEQLRRLSRENSGNG